MPGLQQSRDNKRVLSLLTHWLERMDTGKGRGITSKLRQPIFSGEDAQK